VHPEAAEMHYQNASIADIALHFTSASIQFGDMPLHIGCMPHTIKQCRESSLHPVLSCSVCDKHFSSWSNIYLAKFGTGAATSLSSL